MKTFAPLAASEVHFKVDVAPNPTDEQFDDVIVTAAWRHPGTGALFTAWQAVLVDSTDELDEATVQPLIEARARETGLYEDVLASLNQRLVEAGVVPLHEFLRSLSERDHFHATHRLTVPLSDGSEYVPVMLLPTGDAPCLREWADDRPAEWRHVAGTWLRKGHPVAHLLVERLPRPPRRRD